MSSHSCAFLIGGWSEMIRSMALVCLVDLRSEALKRHMGDLLLFLLVSDRISAL